MKKRPPKKLKSLENLLQQAEHYSECMMAGSAGIVPLTLMALTPQGFMMHITGRNSTEQDKNRLAALIRLIATAYNASAIATIAESWIVVPKRLGQQLDMSVRPSQSPDRKEVVAIVAESRVECVTRFLFIQRDSFGKFSGFGTSLLPESGTDLEGRFAGLMPPEEPTEQMMAAAKNLLQQMGVSVERRGIDQRWN